MTDPSTTDVDRESLRSRLYEAYATTHAGVSTSADSARLAFRRDILPHLPEDRDVLVVDLGCGQGQLVQQLLDHGYQSATGIDISPEQVEIAHRSGISQVTHGDFRVALNDASFDVITATDFFEHLTKSEILQALDKVHDVLRPGGRLIMRVPNSLSPFGANFRYGDLTHETSFTGRSLRQLAAAGRFDRVELYECQPVAHGIVSFARRAVWKSISGLMKLALAAETGATRGHLVTMNVVAVFHKTAA